MMIRKLTTWQEWLEAERVTSVSFFIKFNREKSKKKYMDQAEGKQPRTEEVWGSFSEDGILTSSLRVYYHQQIFDGNTVGCGELDMVCSLPESREHGNIKNIVRSVFDELIEKGFLFSFLHPFSTSYYRQFGFEICNSPLLQKIPVAELKDFPCDYKAKMVETKEDLKIVRTLYEQFIQDKNLSFVHSESEWVLREDGDFGPVDIFNGRKTKYTYIFTDERDRPRGYLKFFFDPTQSVFLGTLDVVDIVYDSPEAFHNIMGFIYKMRAKCETLSMELPEKIDLTMLIPNADQAERILSSHSMARILHVKKSFGTYAPS